MLFRSCDSTKINQFVTTDATGKFNFKLDEPCCYKLRGEKDKYFAVTTPDTICTKGLVMSKGYMVNLNLQPSAVTEPKPTGDVTNVDPKTTSTANVLDPNTLYLDTDKNV